MKCRQVQSRLSSYMDSALANGERKAVSAHLISCLACAGEFAALQRSQFMVSSLGRRPAPADLALRIRIAVSQQRSMTWQRRMQGLFVRMENALNMVMIPATGGVITAVLVFGLLIGFFAGPRSSSANDVPTLLYTPPKLVAAPFSDGVSGSSPVIVEALVDSDGRVVDYRILGDQENERIRRELDRALLFTTFQPATSFGEPTPGKIVLSFANINVKG